MSMEFAAWNSLYSVMTAQQDRRPFSWATVRRILTFVRSRRRMLAGFLALSVVGAVLAVATPLLAGRVVDALVNRQSFTIVWQLALLIAVIALVEAGVGLLGRWLSARIGEGLILDLRQAVFDHVQKMPIAFFTRTRTGALVSRLNNDVIGAQRAFSDTLSGVVGNLVALALTLVVMLRISWEITVLALVLLPIFVLPARRMGRRLARMELEAANHNSVMSTQMTERFSAPGRDPGEAVRPAGARVGRVRRPGRAGPGHRRPHRDGADRLHDRADDGVVAGAGPGLRSGRLLRAERVAGARLGGRAGPVDHPVVRAADRVGQCAGRGDERAGQLRAGLRDLGPQAVDHREAGRGVGAGRSGRDRVRQVGFGYPAADKVSLASLEEVAVLDTRGGVEVIHDVSFVAEPGQVVALVGSSGAGKSTIASLATRLYDADSGTVSIGGVDVRDLSFASIRETLGLVTQDGHLFHESVRENLLLAKENATEDELWEALRRARLDALVASLPDGLDTVVGERGYRLSGGERQRLTIARLLLAHPRVVILDEATAHLDSTSELAVQAALAEALAGRTALVIAHRLSTVRSADLILVVEDGRIVERGQHDQLLAAGGRYAELYRTQFASECTGRVRQR